MYRKISMFMIFLGIILIIVGHYEKDKKYYTSPKIVYKFIDQDIGEDYVRQQESVYNTYISMFEDRSLGAS